MIPSAMILEDMVPAISAVVNSHQVHVRTVFAGGGERSDWCPWVICPVRGYIETGNEGPYPARNFEALEVDPIRIRKKWVGEFQNIEVDGVMKRVWKAEREEVEVDGVMKLVPKIEKIWSEDHTADVIAGLQAIPVEFHLIADGLIRIDLPPPATPAAPRRDGES